jgi:hypothetical protein
VSPGPYGSHTDQVSDVLLDALAVEHGDEHVIKLTEAVGRE